MGNVRLRYQKVSDAKRYYEILSNPNLIYPLANPKSVRAEISWLRKNAEKIKSNTEHNYAILYKDTLVGACGITINQHRKHIGEIGYFLDEPYWGRGITTLAIKQLTKIGFAKLKLERLEIHINPKNLASERVAIKCGFKKEAKIKKGIKMRNNTFQDCYQYARLR
jgi:[ribosomal protein S5]-alanine N-acetyltransferase